MPGSLTQLRVVSDPTGLIVARQWPGYINNASLAAAVSETQTPPAGAKTVVITPNADVWMNKNAAATVPAADVTDGGGQMLCPAGLPSAFGLNDVTTFGLIGAAITLVCIEYYS